jgi:hypothetical protein
MRRHFTDKQIREASGEKLLLMAIFGQDYLRTKIQREQSRRARTYHRMESALHSRHGSATPLRAA